METIVYLDSDLDQAKKYLNTRYDFSGSKSYWLNKNFDQSSMTYIKPDSFNWEKKLRDGNEYKVLSFPNTTNYAFLSDVNVKNTFFKQLTKEGEIYLEIDGGACLGDNCLLDENIISIVVPKRYKISWKEANVLPQRNAPKYVYDENINFVVVNNTVTMYAKQKAGAIMRLWLKDTSSAADIYKAASKSLKQYKGIDVKNTGKETKILLPVDDLFSSGSATTKATGRQWLISLAQSLKNQRYSQIRVDGHSDSIPIKSSKYPSNWELSGARASDAVRILIQNGITKNKIAAVGYADTKPIASNTSIKGRAKNRRIEITIVAVDDSMTSP